MTVHAEKRVIAHHPADLYQLVADVGRYPEFLPWCLAARVHSKTDARLIAELIIGFQMFRERFTSTVTLIPEQLEIDVEYDIDFKIMT